jgi:ribosomal protein S18 acetylase RimI-like enzyme
MAILIPDLIMKRETMSAIPAYRLPVGYEIRGVSPSDVSTWLSIWRENESLEKIPDGLFERVFGTNWTVIQTRCLILYDSTASPVGTVSAWFDDMREPGRSWGQIHWLALSPKLHGQGLGNILLSQGMERLRALGHQRCYLVTQFWRQVAIKLYLQFGFNPELSSDEEASAWKETYAAISGNSIAP